MFTINEEGTITFKYESNQLFYDVTLLSSYMTKNLATEEGSLMDEFNITEDEKSLYDVCLKQAMPYIADLLLKISRNTSSYVKERDSVNYIEFTVEDNKAYNQNALGLVESTIYDCLKYGVLAEFYSVCINASLQKIAQAKFNSCLMLLNQRLFQLKKKPTSSLYM